MPGNITNHRIISCLKPGKLAVVRARIADISIAALNTS
jgi:hypothetical protein